MKGEGRWWIEEAYVPHNHRDRKRRLRLLAIPMCMCTDRRSTTLGDIPRCTGLRMQRIRHIRCGLGVETDGVESSEDGVDEEREDRRPSVRDIHDGFDEEDEHREDRDDHIEGCYTVERINQYCRYIPRPAKKEGVDWEG